MPDLVVLVGILDIPYFTLDCPPLSGEDIYIYVKSEGGGAPDDGTGGTRSLIVGESPGRGSTLLLVWAVGIERAGAKRQPGL